MGTRSGRKKELEAEYGEHLRNLEKVLLELRQEQAEQAEERRCQSRLAALKQKKKEEAAAAAAAVQKSFPVEPWEVVEAREGRGPDAKGVCGVRVQ